MRRVSCWGLMLSWVLLCFFFNDTATTEIYPLSLHDALPILVGALALGIIGKRGPGSVLGGRAPLTQRSEEHTSELQSHVNLVCRLLLETKQHTSESSHMSISYAVFCLKHTI